MSATPLQESAGESMVRVPAIALSALLYATVVSADPPLDVRPALLQALDGDTLVFTIPYTDGPFRATP